MCVCVSFNACSPKAMAVGSIHSLVLPHPLFANRRPKYRGSSSRPNARLPHLNAEVSQDSHIAVDIGGPLAKLVFARAERRGVTHHHSDTFCCFVLLHGLVYFAACTLFREFVLFLLFRFVMSLLLFPCCWILGIYLFNGSGSALKERFTL